MNCWEFMKCGYGPRGKKSHKVGMCTAAMESRLNGVHGGTNGGRACWVVEDTHNQRYNQQNFAQKFVACLNCPFCKKVKEEEAESLLKTEDMIKILR